MKSGFIPEEKPGRVKNRNPTARPLIPPEADPDEGPTEAEGEPATA